MGVRLHICNQDKVGGDDIKLENVETSVDMVDLVVKLNSDEFGMIINPKVDNLKYDPRLTYWADTRWNRYRHNWTWKDEDKERNEYSFYFSYSLNISEELKTRFRVSYNPNKVPDDDEVLSYIINVIKRLGVVIHKADIAFDYIGVTTSDLIFDKGRKREFKIFKYPESDYTYYLGRSGTNGAVKIYDKASEEGANGEYNKTRYEVTVAPDVEIKDIGKYVCRVELPILYFNGIGNFYDDKEMSLYDKLLIFGVENGYPMDKLGYRPRKKYEKLTDELEVVYTKIEPEQVQIEQALKEYVVRTFFDSI